MKLWQYNALSVVLGLVVVFLCGLILPATHLLFMLMGYHVTVLVVAFICGRCVLRRALPGTYEKIQETRCQHAKRVA